MVLHFFQTKANEDTQLKTSGMQASKGAIRIGIDGYAGYFPFRTDALKNQLLKIGYRLELNDDNGDYEQRVAAIADGSLDMAVFTVDSYVLNGARADYPGSIVAVLSESTGSDGIVSSNATLTSLDAIKNAEQVRVAYTPNSPSQHLLKSVAVDFGMDRFLNDRGDWSLPVSGSVDALAALKKGTAEVAILWEPELSAAINDLNYTRLLGTESTRGLIVDVLVVNRKVLSEQPELVSDFLVSYFQQLNSFRKDRAAFIDALAKDSGTSKTVAEEMANGIAWKGFETNKSIWLGLNTSSSRADQFQLYDTIERTVQILIDFGDFKSTPLPQGDPRSLIFTGVLEQLGTQFEGALTSDEASADALSHEFSKLSPSQWQRLPEVGTLKLRPIAFQSGTNTLSETGVEAIEQMIQSLKHYPNFRVVVSGHTSSRGNTDANKALSLQRAQVVVDYIVHEFAVDPDRLQAFGNGGDKPLSKKPGESFRAFQNRLSRVEFNFVRDSL
ncbi:MAG: phosphate ABC transporter substrate-binding/OmpA family protein [Opitutaceae bacterium]